MIKLKNGIQAARNTGVSCLRNEVHANELANDLSHAFSNSNPTTQVCCANNCSAGAPFFTGNGAGIRGAVAIATTKSANPNNGTLYVLDTNISQSNMNATIFHEMLHRTGQCNSQLHSQPMDTLIDERHTPPHCSEGYIQASMPRDFRRIYGIETVPISTHEDFVSQVTANITGDLRTELLGVPASGEICVLANPCGSGRIMTSLLMGNRHFFDPTYACERACFNHPPGIILNHVRQLCLRSQSTSRTAPPNQNNFCP